MCPSPLFALVEKGIPLTTREASERLMGAVMIGGRGEDAVCALQNKGTVVYFAMKKDGTLVRGRSSTKIDKTYLIGFGNLYTVNKEIFPDSIFKAGLATEQRQGMTEAETITFLRERGVESLPLQEYQTGQTVLYVMEQSTLGDHGPFKKMPANERPAIARIDNPGRLDLGSPYRPDKKDPDQTRIVYDLYNHGGRVDYYMIDAQTKKPTLVKTSHTVTDFHAKRPIYPYKVRPENLFKANDELFPKGTL